MKTVTLIYHGILFPEANRYTISKKYFIAQLDWLKSNHTNALSVDKLLSEIALSNAIGMTFDDGYLSDYETALPELLDRSFTATFFLSTDKVNSYGYVSWGQVRQMREYGMEIGSHGVSHSLLTMQSSSDILKELKDSKDVLQQQLGHEVSSFSIPFGFYNDKILNMAIDVGYKIICTSDYGQNMLDGNCLKHKRIAVNPGVSMDDFVSIVNSTFPRYYLYMQKHILIKISKQLLGVNGYVALRKLLLKKW